MRGDELIEALSAAAHHAMCDVSHHDSTTRCKNQRKYELIGTSMAQYLEFVYLPAHRLAERLGKP